MPFWIEDPTILFHANYILDIIPTSTEPTPSNLNALSRLVLVCSVLGYIIGKHYLWLILGAIILGIIAMFYKEGFTNRANYTPSIINKSLSTINPLGNTLMHEYTHNPTKKDTITKIALKPDTSYGKTASYESDYGPATEKAINDKTKEFIYSQNADNKNIKDLFKDVADNMEFEHQMRQFHTTPNTTIPNDQPGFLNYCYGILPSNKSVLSH